MMGLFLKWIMCVLCVLLNASVFSRHSIDSPLFRTNNAKEEHSEEDRSEHYFKKEQIINDPVIPVVDEAPSLLCLLQ